MTQNVSTTLLQGGLNLITPAIATPPGHCIAAQNYEPEARGYRRFTGYERFDGRPKPSAASYFVLNFDAGSTAVSAGQTVTGATSGATGIALVAGTLSTGSYGGGNAAGYLVLYNVTGTFQDNENLQVSAATVAVANGVALEFGADNDTDNTTWFRATATARRSAITAVPGSGPVRGVWIFAGSVYAFRDNVGATAGVMHKATSSGWVAQTLGHVVEFTLGTAEFEEGETLTKGGVTAVIRRVVKMSGGWGTDAAGYLVITNISGGSFSSGVATSASGSATLSGAETANTLPAGGRYAFVNHNFYGSALSERMYGCNGVGRGFMWDGTYFTPIRTTLDAALDKPTRIAEFSNHLFLGYATGEIIFSAIGEPLTYSTTLGAGSFSFGQEVTDMGETASTALTIFGRNKSSYLSGQDVDTFVLNPLNDAAGAIPWTVQVMDSPIYMDDAGVRRMTSTQAYGNFRLGTLTELIEPWFDGKEALGVTPVGSLRNKAKDQYILFMSDKSGIIIYLGRKRPESMPIQLDHTVTCTCSGTLSVSAGREQLFFGSDDGYVYEYGVGTSFDGEEVQAYMLLPFNSVGSHPQKKRFHRARLEVDAGPDTQISMSAEFDYGNPDNPVGSEQSFNVSGGGGFWNAADWNRAYLSAPVQGVASAELYGIGRNVAIGILSNATWELPHTMSSISIYSTMRGQDKV